MSFQAQYRLMLQTLKKFTDPIFNLPLLYKGLRTFFLGGLPTDPILRLLESNASDMILDIGCGTGFLAEKIPFRLYVGLDRDPKMIEIAQRKKIPHSIFTLTPVQDYDFSNLHPTKAVLYGVLHHLNDKDAVSLLRMLRKTGVARLVTLDPIYSQFHFINNLLCKLDRGEYVRNEMGMLQLVEQAGLRVERKLLHYSNTVIAKYLILRLTP